MRPARLFDQIGFPLKRLSLMNQILTAQQLFSRFQQLPAAEREEFLRLLSASPYAGRDNLSHEEVFGHLRDEEFTAGEAADYLDVSMATFRRYVRAGKIVASSEVGTTHLYRLTALRELKKNLGA